MSWRAAEQHVYTPAAVRDLHIGELSDQALHLRHSAVGTGTIHNGNHQRRFMLRDGTIRGVSTKWRGELVSEPAPRTFVCLIRCEMVFVMVPSSLWVGIMAVMPGVVEPPRPVDVGAAALAVFLLVVTKPWNDSTMPTMHANHTPASVHAHRTRRYTLTNAVKHMVAAGARPCLGWCAAACVRAQNCGAWRVHKHRSKGVALLETGTKSRFI